MTARSHLLAGRRKRRGLWLLIVLAVVGGCAYAATRPPGRVNVLTADGSAAGPTGVSVMDFSVPMSLDPPPQGWWHRTFWTRRAAAYSVEMKGGRAALRVETNNSASMLQRFVDIDLAAYPVLT